jgi:hypothetical protein
MSVPKNRRRDVFFTIVLAGRSSELLVKYIERLRLVYRVVQARLPFETNAICALPDHLGKYSIRGANRVRKIAQPGPGCSAWQNDFAHPTELRRRNALRLSRLTSYVLFRNHA